MHILVTNDDGPPSNQSSPYVHTLVSTLQQAGHTVSVCLPDTQKSWIGKAHMIGQTLTPSYYRPGTILQDNGTTSPRPFNDGKEEWVLVDGTPASCTQIGLHHVFKDRPPIELVLSGPNYGRNTTAVFSLSSGTIGAALEGAVNGVKSIALSYAFDQREHDADIIAAASRVSTRLIEKLVAEWPKDVQLYSVNVPLRVNVETTKISYTNIIQNKWYGSSFTEVPESSSDKDPNAEEQKIRHADGGAKNESAASSKLAPRPAHMTFKWSPSFADVRMAVEEAGSGDGWTVLQGEISVTPLRANYWHLPHYSGEIKLDDKPSVSLRIHSTLTTPASPSPPSRPHVTAIINYPDPYVQPLILSALSRISSVNFTISTTTANSPTDLTLQITSYETLDFIHAQSQPTTSLISAYVIRKALIRKHYLSNTIATWLVKRPDSLLARHVKPAVHFELDFAEFLDEALVDAWDLNESLARNDDVGDEARTEWWILKPGMSDGGNGIRLFSSMGELQGIFEEWEPEEESDEEDEDEDEDEDEREDETVRQADGDETRDRAMTSQLRHFIAQPYIDPPLLLSSYGKRKFHIRTYVLAVGALKVYVYREMLALFAAKPYQTPNADESNGEIDLSQHLTNTCFQSEESKAEAVHRFWSLKECDTSSLPPTISSFWQEDVFSQICQVTGEVFEAAARDQMIHFQAVPNAFEIFGIDFLVDAEGVVWLLEMNAYPDFKQTGDGLRDVVVGGLFEEVVKVGVVPFFSPSEVKEESGTERMVLVKSVDLGRR